jgi:FkbM family methyltransferase
MMLYRAVRRFNFLKAVFGREPFHWLDRNIATEHHGSSYGGWALLKDSLNSDSIVYSLGIGQDVTFDLSIINRYQNQVYAYDPTPKSIDWVSANVREPKFIFHPMAAAALDGTIHLFEPNSESADQVSASMIQTGDVTTSFDAPCQTIETMFNVNRHDHCDVLKMDIEGAEYSILSQLCKNGLIQRVKQLLVEFHHFLPGVGVARTKHCVEQLRQAGFEACWISRTNHEYLFARSDIANQI